MAVRALLAEVSETAEYLASRENLSDKTDAAIAMRRNLADTLTLSIARLPALCAKDATLFANLLKHNPFGEFTARIQKAVDGKIQSSSMDVVSLKQNSGASTTAVHVYPQNYLTQQEWDILRNTQVTPHCKLATLAHRICLLGINPHEQTIRWWVALFVICAFPQLPCGPDIHRWVLALKQASTTQRFRVPFAPLLHFPEHVTELPDAIKAFAYAENDAVEIAVTELADVATNRVPLRANSNLLTEDYRCTLKRKGFSSAPAVVTPKKDPPLLDWSSPSFSTPATRDTQPRLDLQGGGQVDLGNGLTLHNPLPTTENSVASGRGLALPAKLQIPEGFDLEHDSRQVQGGQGKEPEPAEPEDDPSVEEEPAAENVNAYAAAAIASLQKRDAKKSSSSKVGGPMKRPAGGPMKRPAAAAACEAATPAKLPKCPPIGQDRPFEYKGGRIYWRDCKRIFQIVRRRGDNNSIRRMKWKDAQPSLSEWQRALHCIDDFENR